MNLEATGPHQRQPVTVDRHARPTCSDHSAELDDELAHREQREEHTVMQREGAFERFAAGHARAQRVQMFVLIAALVRTRGRSGADHSDDRSDHGVQETLVQPSTRRAHRTPFIRQEVALRNLYDLLAGGL